MGTQPPHELAAQELEHATALPARFYCEPSLAALERRHIFDRAWQSIAHVCQLTDVDGPRMTNTPN